MNLGKKGSTVWVCPSSQTCTLGEAQRGSGVPRKAPAFEAGGAEVSGDPLGEVWELLALPTKALWSSPETCPGTKCPRLDAGGCGGEALLPQFPHW